MPQGSGSHGIIRLILLLLLTEPVTVGPLPELPFLPTTNGCVARGEDVTLSKSTNPKIALVLVREMEGKPQRLGQSRPEEGQMDHPCCKLIIVGAILTAIGFGGSTRTSQSK